MKKESHKYSHLIINIIINDIWITIINYKTTKPIKEGK